MQTLTVARASTLAGVVGLFFLVASPSTALACKCQVPTVESSYNSHSDVMTADIRFQLTLGSTRYYVARVDRAFKGCLTSGDWVVLSTPVESATCGAQLESRTHLINGDAAGRRFGLAAFTINSCSYNVAASELTEHDLAFLNGRTICCGDACACADCPSGEWCRQTQNDDTTTETEPHYGCVPFVGDGESCGGFTPAWLYERCASDLTCVVPDGVIDAPGTCRQGCSADADCSPQGCSDTVCAAEPVITTCEWRPEYACYDNAKTTQCGCHDGQCSWSQTEALAQCLASGGPAQ